MKNRPLCSICLVVFVLMCIGIHVGGERFLRELKPSVLELSVPEKAVIHVTGQIYKKEVRENYQILYLKNNSIHYQQQSLNESKIIVYDETAESVKIGNVIKAEGKISFYQEARNPGNFNQKLYYQRQNIHASVWASEVQLEKDTVKKYVNALYDFRQSWKVVLLEALGEKYGMTLSAILLGEKAELDEKLKTLYQVNGIGHILAISGLHLSFIGIGMYRLLRRMCGSYAAGGTAAILFLLSYIVMVGLTVSALRALVMFLFRVGADMCGRHYDSPTALSAAALAALIWRPLYIYDGGFWLSYGAVLAMLMVLPFFEKLPMQGLWASLSIHLFILPVLLYYFYELPIYSILLNLFIIPLMSVFMFLGIAGSIVSWIMPIPGMLVLEMCKIILWFYEQSCRLAVKLPGARIVTGQPEVWQMVFYYICLAAGLVLLKHYNEKMAGNKDTRDREEARHVKRRKWIGVLCLLVGTVVLTMRFGESGNLQITVIDVGQGDSIFIKGPKGGTYLVDGGSSDVKKVGQYRIEPFLKSQGVGVLDYVFVSHGDRDHISGIEELLERKEVGVKIRSLVLPERNLWDEHLEELAKQALDTGVRVVTIDQSESLKEEALSFTCLQPDKNADIKPGNAASMVLALQFGEFDMLLTGDVEDEGEEMLMEYMKQNNFHRSIEVLKVAHHGSKNSTKEEFLDLIHSCYAIISAGVDNRYGHPHAETIERLEEDGSKIYSTQDCGAIIIRVKEEKMFLKSFISS